jgi:hypothetical protein
MLRRRRLLLSIVLLSGLSGIVACHEFEAIRPGCGNRVVEPKLGEVCDSSSDAASESGSPTACGAPLGEFECRFVSDEEHDCPTGYRKGPGTALQACVKPSKEFGVIGTLPGVVGTSPQIAHLDGDGQLDLTLAGVSELSTHFVTRTIDGFTSTPGVETRGALLELDGGGAPDLVAFDPKFRGLVFRLFFEDRTHVEALWSDPLPGTPARHVWVPAKQLDNLGNVVATDKQQELMLLFGDPSFCEDDQVCAKQLSHVGVSDATPVPLDWLPGEGLSNVNIVSVGRNTVVGLDEATTLKVFGSASQLLSGDGPALLLPGPLAPKSLVLQDLDRDGVTDLGGAYCGDDFGTMMVAGGPTMWADQTALTTSTIIDGATFGCTYGGPAVGLVNSDAFADVMWGYRTWLSDREPLLYVDESKKSNQGAEATGDLNNDGRIDLVYRQEGVLRVALGGDEAPLSDAVLSDRPVRALAIADLDGDGFDDVLVGFAATSTSCAGREGYDELAVAYGHASGFPEPFQTIGTIPGIEALTPGVLSSEFFSKGDYAPLEDGVMDVAITHARTCGGLFSEEAAQVILQGDTGRRPFASYYPRNEKDNDSEYVGRLRRVAGPTPGDDHLLVTTASFASSVPIFSAVLQSWDFSLPSDPLITETRLQPPDAVGETYAAPQTALRVPDGRVVLALREADLSEPFFTGLRLEFFPAESWTDETGTFQSTRTLSLPASQELGEAQAPLFAWTLLSLETTDGSTLGALVDAQSLGQEAIVDVIPTNLFFADLDPTSDSGEARRCDPPVGTMFRALAIAEDENYERVFVVATQSTGEGEASSEIRRIHPDDCSLTPFADGLVLGSEPVTGLTVGDFDQDGLEDLVLVDTVKTTLLGRKPLAPGASP